MKKKKNNIEFSQYISIKDEAVLDASKYGIELVDPEEVFVQVHDTRNYWISNKGRLINNLRGYFYIHKTDKKHKISKCTHLTLTAYDGCGSMYKINTFLDILVAEHFLEKISRCNRVYHIDGNVNNCDYKNLIWVSTKEQYELRIGNILVSELIGRRQFIPYITSKTNNAYHVWNGIYKRCYENTKYNIGNCYNEATMCEQWLNDKELFAEWYNANYYECDGESMAVDKDLLCPGNKEYAPDKCCIIPQTINTALSNCKKHTLPAWRNPKVILPLGVRYDEYMQKYYGEIRPYGYDEVVKLSYKDTPEEAFEEYKKFKQADLLIMAAKYKSRIPKNVYEAMLKVDVKPY